MSNLTDAPANNQWPPKVILRACSACNRGLGEEFENKVAPILKPLMAGGRHFMSREQMALVGAWAWLKDIEYVLGRNVLWTTQGQAGHTPRSLAHWRGQLASLRRERRPPRGYIVRLATIGSPSDGTPYRPLTPDGWRQEHAHLVALNGVGLLLIESRLTTRENAAEFIRATRTDTRATLVWPALRTDVTVGSTTVPLHHAERWRQELNFHPNSGWGGGWRIRVPHQT
jgi:hypothetical protein